ncbi:hypothetical protein FIU95_18745 [Microbulbifer sp. THAF38]|nr:hypothetical protein FIU95_18745 [Microbulbifer sp. THAF38]
MLQRFSKSIKNVDEAMAAAKGLQKQRDSLAKLSESHKKNRVNARRAKREIDIHSKKLEDAAAAADKYGISIDNVDKKLKHLEKRSKALDKLSSFGKFIKNKSLKPKGSMEALAAVPGIQSAISLFQFVKDTADSGTQTKDTAEKLGFSFEGLQRNRFAAERSGVSPEIFDMGAQNMVESISNLAGLNNGDKISKKAEETSKALTALGLEAQALAQMSPEEQLKAIADAMSSIENKGNRVAIADKIFGADAVGMVNMLNGGSDNLDKLYNEADATGNVLDKDQLKQSSAFNASWLKLTTTLTGFKNTIATELMPTLMGVFETFSAWLQKPEAKEFIKDFVLGFIEIFKGIGTLISKFSEFGSAAKSIGAVLTGIMTVVLLPFISLLSLPGLIVAGIITAVGLLWVHWDKVVSLVSQFGNWLINIRDNTLGSFWDVLTEGAHKAFTQIKDFVSQIFGNTRIGQLFRGASSLSNKLFGTEISPGAPSEEIAAQAGVKPRGSNNVTVQNSINSPINIYPAQGMDEEAIARKMGEELEKRQRNQEVQQRSALFDLGILNGALA